MFICPKQCCAFSQPVSLKAISLNDLLSSFLPTSLSTTVATLAHIFAIKQVEFSIQVKTTSSRIPAGKSFRSWVANNWTKFEALSIVKSFRQIACTVSQFACTVIRNREEVQRNNGASSSIVVRWLTRTSKSKAPANATVMLTIPDRPFMFCYFAEEEVVVFISIISAPDISWRSMKTLWTKLSLSMTLLLCR